MAMGFKHFIFALLAGLALIIIAVHAQNQPAGFISIACGLPENFSFTETKTGINYTSDATYIDTGVCNKTSTEFIGYPQQVRNLRSFPEGIRNCYTINVTAGTKYLIRATFLHGNYDGNGNLPQFDLYLGANMWDTIKFNKSSIEVTKELIHVPSLNYIHVCLVKSGLRTPFISAIELRPLPKTSYVTKSGSLALYRRADVGLKADLRYRYPDDVYDRFWEPYNKSSWSTLNSTNLSNDSQSHNDYLRPPSVVMRTAATPANDSTPLEISWDSENATTEYYVYMYFAEVVKLQPNHVKKQTKKGKREKLKPNKFRSFNITLNGKYWYGPLVPQYLNTTLYNISAISGKVKYNISFVKSQNSTLLPIINAMEIYFAKNFSQSETDQGDVHAITKIKSTYEIKRNWQGDPCAPKEFSWEGLNCSDDGDSPPRITSLDLSNNNLTGPVPDFLSQLQHLRVLSLSSSGLVGNISADISNLVMLQNLDLSNNNLTGPVPNFLSRLQNLTVL